MKKLLSLLFTIVVVFQLNAQVNENHRDTLGPSPTGDCGPLLILSQPASQSACPDSNVIFISSAAFYDSKVWQSSTNGGITWNDIPGTYVSFVFERMGPDTLILTGVTQAMNNNYYRCNYYKGCRGYLNTNPASLIVGSATSITSQPTNVNACSGNAVDFTITAIGNSLGYQWQLSTDGGNSFSNINNAMSSTLHFATAILSMNNNKYRCALSSNCASIIYSNPGILIVNPSPNLGNDTSVNLSCQTCVTDISGFYNTAGYNTINWNTPDPANVFPGIYRLSVSNSYPCYDAAFIFVNINDSNILQVCKGANASLNSDTSGASYQWQVNNGTGFTNISNGSNYSGATTAKLSLINIPSGFYGYQYRCKVNNTSYSTTSTVRITSLWNGNISSAWEDPANWGCGSIPDGNTDIYLYSGKPNNPVINSNTTGRSVHANPGTTLTVNPGYKLTLTGLH